MQKISTYLYPNRIQLLADLAGFTTEYTNVYQRTVKIYNGIDNTIEFDIKNADQKRIDLSALTCIELNVMDAKGAALPSSPYSVTPLDQTSHKGLAKVTIPYEDLEDLSAQYLKYSVSAVKDGNDILLYGDSRFGAVGTMELVGNAMPTVRPDKTYKTFTAEIDSKGVPIFHSSVIPAKFYEAVPTEFLNFEIHVRGFAGSIWLEATTNDTTNVEAWRAAGKPFGSWTQLYEDGLFTGVISYGSDIPVGEYANFRVSYQTTMVNGQGADFIVKSNGSGYSVTINNGGTGYSKGARIRVPGSQLGGVDDDNDLIITVNGVLGTSSTMASSYTMSEVTKVSVEGTPATSGQWLVSGFNDSGIIDKVVVS